MLIHHFDFLITLLILLSFNLTCNTASPLNKITSSSAFFIFGDSSVDPGNNNYINTIPENRANYEPYGQNGFFQEPTGRFSDGRVVVDYIAEYANLPIIPPFLLPSAEFTHGANFASGGAGILSETNRGVVIDLKTQLKNFEEVQKTLRENLGDEKTNELISEAVYFFSIGSNDYMGGYLGNPVMQQNYLPEEYVGMVIGNLTNAIQVLYEKGGFRVSSSMKYLMYHYKVMYIMIHGYILLLIGFKDGVNACCGTGPFGGIFSCGGTKAVVEYQVCENADGHVWWDSFHPTEKIHKEFAKALWNSNSVQPYNLEDLFFDREKSTIGDIVDDQEAMQY
ncbi:hypothetical protein IFM89_022485 [Coptis chinensis]|uniref:Uncharacterized protein n=1 Tax=Coptis chinensis TaxID=261450 RepID=A0A835IGC1_9MAGN|nr:hypothetical protein IFM89_022485 [Coptis chinensis]